MALLEEAAINAAQVQGPPYLNTLFVYMQPDARKYAIQLFGAVGSLAVSSRSFYTGRGAESDRHLEFFRF